MERHGTGWNAFTPYLRNRQEVVADKATETMRSRPFSWARILTAAAAVGLTAAFVVAAPRASAFGSYPTPAIAVAGSNTVIATQTSGDGLRFYWNVHGSENLAYFGYSDGPKAISCSPGRTHN
jgi:hypothetical protein